MGGMAEKVQGRSPQTAGKGNCCYCRGSLMISKVLGCAHHLPQGTGAQTRRGRERRERAGGIQTNRPPLCCPQLPFTEDKPGLHFRVSISAAQGWRASFSGDEDQELSANRQPRVQPQLKGNQCQIGQWQAHL